MTRVPPGGVVQGSQAAADHPDLPGGWTRCARQLFGCLARLQIRVRAARRGLYPPGMDLREELPSDRQAVRDVHLRAFGDHGLVVADLVDGLRDIIAPENGLSLIAEHDRQIVGHVMFTPSLLDAPRR